MFFFPDPGLHMQQIVTFTKSARRTKQTRTASPTQVPEPDLARALDLVMELMQIPGPSCHEGEVAAPVREKLLKAGVPAAAILSDDAHRRSPAGGEVGNLIVRLPGTIRGPRRFDDGPS